MAGIISRLFGPAEKRSDGDEIVRVLSGSGGSVTPDTALQLATVLACVRVLAESVATLPLELRAHEARGSRKATEHPLYTLLHDLPNPEMTSFDMRMTMMGHLGTWGNAYAQKVPDRSGRWIELWPLVPNRMEGPVRAADGDLIYPYYDAYGRKRVFRRWEILHIRGLSPDGVVGYSPISLARKTFERKLRMEQFEQAFYDNGAQPGALLKHPGQLSDKAYNRLLNSWEDRHRGARNANKVAILEEGLDLISVGVPQADAQFLDSQKFTRSEIAGLFRVPSHMINDLDRATFSNIEHLSLEFVIDTLTPWLEAWEQAIYRDLLTPDERRRYYAKHKLQSRLRGDNQSRGQFYSLMLQWGVFCVNDVRELEDLNPIADGDTYFVPLNMMPISQAATGQAVATAPAAANAVRSYLHQHGDEACTCDACQERKAFPGKRADGVSDEDEDLRTSRVEMARAMEPVLDDIAVRVTRREVRDVRKLVDKHLRKRAQDEFLDALRELYNEFDGVVEDAFRAALLSYARQAMLAASAELGKKSKGLTDELRQFVTEYLASMGDGWASSSRLQIEILLQEAADTNQDPAAMVDERLTRWEDTKPGKVADRHAFEALNALVIASYGAHQVRLLRWLAAGASCPFCQQLSGKVAGIEEYFIQAGTSLDGGGAEPMLISRNVRHGPLHGGCDCVVVAGG